MQSQNCNGRHKMADFVHRVLQGEVGKNNSIGNEINEKWTKSVNGETKDRLHTKNQCLPLSSSCFVSILKLIAGFSKQTSNYEEFRDVDLVTPRH
ncbi:hypothetical protein RUM43_000501 [Polyplax serrata]|uniref:Uncharacterized protein n=1 Tax=Polyplax serrata TaxID=468196 RepID=A0AAN8SDF7_POLSC